jgi:hypothetical protein
MLVVCLCLHFLLSVLQSLDFFYLEIIQVPLYDLFFDIQLSILIIFDSLFLVFGLLPQGLSSGACFLALIDQVNFFLTRVFLSLVQARLVQVVVQGALEREALVHVQHLELEERTHSLLMVSVQNILHWEMLLVPLIEQLGVGCGLASRLYALEIQIQRQLVRALTQGFLQVSQPDQLLKHLLLVWY